MNPTIKSLFLLSAVIGLALGSPLEFKAVEQPISPLADGDVNYRLSYDVIPTNYVLDIIPYFANESTKEAFTFDGTVTITIQAQKADVRSIVLHKHDLEIESFTISGGATASGSYNENQYDNVTDKWTINITTPLPFNSPQATSLTIKYRGFMRDDMNGFYRSYYKEGGEKVWMGSTQLQQTEARRVFPCFDEPGFKATFKLKMTRPVDMMTLSNTKILESTNMSTLVPPKFVDDFDVTPPMSTYLVAFIVSKYEGTNNTDVTKPFGVYARKDAKAQTKLALEFGQGMLAKFGEYLGIDYYSVNGVTKMDMAAIPDFSAGAMENWGLLTYRETGILYYENDTPSLNEQRIIAVIAHEQAHMWFGDLVTCKWWSETWLNEGFARYFQYFGTQMLRPDWDLEEQFVVENLQQSMQLDSTDDTHPMTDLTVATKAQASGMFDNISYNKAGSIIRMLSHYIGMEKFGLTLKRYLDDNRYRAVEPADLFTAIEIVNPGNSSLTQWFAPWTSTPGFPLVTVELNGQTLKLKQKRFKRSGINHDSKERYNIPITYAIDSDNYDDTTPKFIFRLENGEEMLANLTKVPQKYYILNTKQNGYYRVNYDANNWNKIKEALYKDDHDKIHVMNRAQIVDDLFNLARAGIVNYETAIDIIRYIKKEKHYIPWLSAINHGLTFLSQRVSGEKNQEVFSWFILDTMSEIYNHLKFIENPSTERRTDIYNRVNVLTWACKYGHEDCIKISKEQFGKVKAGTKIPKDQRSIVYCNAVRHGGQAEFDVLYNKFKIEDIAAEQLNQLIGMACTKDAALVKKYLDLIETDDIRPQDRSAAISNILNSNPEGATLLYNYITANQAKWKKKFDGLGTLSTVAGRFTTKEQFDKYQIFLDGQKTDLGATAYDKLSKDLTSARENLVWDEKYMKEFMEHLTKLKSSAPVKVISILVSAISLAVLFLFN